jgi:hypothetical protein
MTQLQMNQSEGIRVFISNRDSTCNECGENLGAKAWIALCKDKGALCLSCADLDHLVLLPSGNAALTRRAQKHSTLSALVLDWNRTRKHYERHGLLVEAPALEKAEEECLADNDVRARRREREALRREGVDRQYVEQFAKRVRELFPGCPAGRSRGVAEHACLKYSGRVGRSASAKRLDDEALRLAVIAHIRHTETKYDKLLARGHDRWEARAEVQEAVNLALTRWQAKD